MRWRLRLSGVALGLALLQPACSADRTNTASPPQSATTAVATPVPDVPAAPRDAVRSAPAANVPPKAKRKRRANDLTGTWKFFMRTNEWTVDLEPADGSPNEYAGLGERDERNALGNAVLLSVGAIVTNGRLKAWLGPGIVVCDAPFSNTTPVVGECKVVLGEGSPGAFRAQRVP